VKIVLLTYLYPSYKNEPKSSVTYAIHYFVKEWVKQAVEVKVYSFRNYYPYVFSIFKTGRYKRKFAQIEHFQLDDVQVTRIPIKKVPKIPISDKLAIKVANKIKDLLSNDKFTPNIVLSHGAFPSALIAQKLAQTINTNLVICFHDSDIRLLSKKKFFNRSKEFLHYASGFVYRSEKIKKSSNNVFGHIAQNKHSFVVYSGIHGNLIIDGKTLTKKIQKKDKINILTVGTLIKLKNIDILILAFSKVQKIANLTLTIIGEGPEKKKLKNLINRLNIQDSVELIGQVDRSTVIEYMRKADIFALVSSPETFGLVYLEAMANGCITIGSRGEGIDGVIQDNFNGFLCTPDPEELALLLKRVINLSQNEKKRILSNAYKTVINMTDEKVARDYLYYLKFLSSS